MKNILQAACPLIISLALVSNIFSIAVNADNEEVKDGAYYQGAVWQTFRSGIEFRFGGVNSIDGVAAQSREETEALEEKIRKENYILINGEEKEISQEEFDTFTHITNFSPPYVNYLNNNDLFAWEYCRVYVYRPLYNEVMKQNKEKGFVDDGLDVEMLSSSVVIDYGFWEAKERIGMLTNEFNDNIPAWAETGYVRFSSPKTVEFLIEDEWQQTYSKIIVEANKPLLMKFPASVYNFKLCNDIAIDYGDLALPFSNHIVIDSDCTINKPFEVKLNEVIEKYNIPDYVPEEEIPDYSWDNAEQVNNNPALYAKVYEQIPEYYVDVREEKPTQQQEQEEKKDNRRLYIIIGIVVVLILCGGTIKSRITAMRA